MGLFENGGIPPIRYGGAASVELDVSRISGLKQIETTNYGPFSLKT